MPAKDDWNALYTQAEQAERVFDFVGYHRTWLELAARIPETLNALFPSDDGLQQVVRQVQGCGVRLRAEDDVSITPAPEGCGVPIAWLAAVQAVRDLCAERPHLRSAGTRGLELLREQLFDFGEAMQVELLAELFVGPDDAFLLIPARTRDELGGGPVEAQGLGLAYRSHLPADVVERFGVDEAEARACLRARAAVVAAVIDRCARLGIHARYEVSPNIPPHDKAGALRALLSVAGSTPEELHLAASPGPEAALLIRSKVEELLRAPL